MPDRSPEHYEIQKSRSRDWKRSNKDRHAELARSYRRRNPEKVKAQNQLNYAIRMGRIERGPCEACGTTERVHAHHEDYSKPYDVHWLCYICHRKAHPVSVEDKEIKFSEAKHARLFGEENPFSKLTDKDVLEIRKLLGARISQERIGKLYGIGQTCVSKIKLGKSWTHIN